MELRSYTAGSDTPYRAALKVAEIDLTNAQSHVLQFQEISKANEEALISLNATYDEFKASTESQIATHEVRVKQLTTSAESHLRVQSEQSSLREKFEAVQRELRKSNETLAAVQQNLENERKAWTEDKKLLEDTIADMSSAERSIENARASRQGEIQQLEERVKSSGDKYNREVVAHAESIKAVEELRQQLAETKLTVRNATTAAETAQTKLSTSETSWGQQKKALEREVTELNSRQVTWLLVRVDSLICQLVARTSLPRTPSFTITLSQLAHKLPRSVTLRTLLLRPREKERVIPQMASFPSSGRLLDGCGRRRRLSSYSWNLANKRPPASRHRSTIYLRVWIRPAHHFQRYSALVCGTHSRSHGAQERERAAEAATTQADHDILMSKINELTVYRESNATLRAESEAKGKRVAELDAKLRQVTDELAPAKQELLVLRAELDARDSQITRLTQDNRKWQERNQQLLTKVRQPSSTRVQ